MTIGIDAKWYFTGPPSTQTVLRNLLPELLEKYPQHHWIVFLDKKDRKKSFPFQQSNITLQYVWSDVNMLSNLFVLPAFAKKYGIDVLIFQTFARKKKGYTSVAFIHDVLFTSHPQFFTWWEKLYFKPLRKLTQQADHVLASSQFVASELVRLGYRKDSNDITVMPLAAGAMFRPMTFEDKPAAEQLRFKYNLPGRFILFVGRLNERKNIAGLLKAMRLVADDDLRLVIVGMPDGKHGRVEEMLHADPRITHIRYVAPGELPILYALANVFCFPSLAEGFGLPPLEAMASGVPTIVSKNTSLPEVCGNAAIYIDPANPRTIADAIDLLTSDSDLYKRKSEEGIIQAQRFKWATTASHLMQQIEHRGTTNQQTYVPAL